MCSQTTLNEIATLIAETEAVAQELPTLPDMADADMALQYLRHLHRRLVADEHTNGHKGY